jgi:hypothetical protein
MCLNYQCSHFFFYFWQFLREFLEITSSQWECLSYDIGEWKYASAVVHENLVFIVNIGIGHPSASLLSAILSCIDIYLSFEFSG